MPSRRTVSTVLEGDCLDVLETLIRRSKRRFDLVYVDPPFNAGGVRRARGAAGSRAVGEAAYRDQWRGIDEFLAMLEPRLARMRDAMTDAGSLWLHLDHRAIHDAKMVTDRVFGRDRFAGEVIWVPGNGGRKKIGPSVTHQTLLIYSKTKDMIWNVDDPALREPYADTSQRMHFTEIDASGRRYRERTISGKTYRYYADAGRKLGSVWTDCPAMNANTPLTRETTGYPTQKPLKLLERIVRAATTSKSMVLDPMCGSGTTLMAARNLERDAVGIDRSPVACRIAGKRLGLR